ncbi:Riboflavin biosynthesis protein PYRR, chloroplastic-like [Oopsacas minuta]|uniref:Riboflavin biosynthesis protein PYRR, chloroplastic-like n=1 Tax=Oopsacas minuta TaxID=111878 RepID=A0AAV7K7A2_9METZ|nr:Riboflavin biosynthesis protein PYRR, chloroplastic-like [Oopsacas minuta]
MATDPRARWGPFLKYWESFCKDTFISVSISGQEIQFSEGLLNTLCYETDVGCIPRGFKLNTAGDKPKYFHSNNWNKQIIGCYWCKDDNTDYNGICCTKECFFYLHDWCVERVHYFTNRRFCRFPGCDTNKDNSLYCDTKHKAKFESELPKGFDHKSLLKTVIREGPIWYCSNGGLSNVPLRQIMNSTSQSTKRFRKQNMTQNTVKNMPDDKSIIMEFPIDLHNAMIFQTDIGIIPRTPLKEHHLNSPYSSSLNWLRQIEGCYWCGNKSETPVSEGNTFCRYRCYLFFYEWCRSKVCSLTGVDMCMNTGCNKTAAGFDCCSREHTIAIKEKYSQVRIIHSEGLTGPHWYKESDSSQNSIHLSSKIPQQPIVVDNQSNIKVTNNSSTELDITMNSDYNNPFLETISTPKQEANLPTDIFNNITSYNMLYPSTTYTESTKPITQDHLHTLETDSSIYSKKELGLPQNPFLHYIQESNNMNLPVVYPFTLSRKLTNLLAQYTDVGIIPRNSYNQQASEYSTHNNWRMEITGCYWCELSNTSFHGLTCGKRCWLLFHEWCVRKLETSCGVKLCVLPGCENSRAAGCVCCSLEHIKDISELRGNLSLNIEEEVELILGPKWYSDLSPIHFSRTGAFYEFSIYFPSLLFIQGSIWPSVYHYLCAQKLVGTPYSNRICRMECVSELERWMKRRTCEKWVRPDWERILEQTIYKAVLAKFQQNSILRGLLIMTGMRPLVCRDSSLGDMLVGIREGFKFNQFYSDNSIDVSFVSLPKVPNLKIGSKASSTGGVKIQKGMGILPRKVKHYSSSDYFDSDSWSDVSN